MTKVKNSVNVILSCFTELVCCLIYRNVYCMDPDSLAFIGNLYASQEVATSRSLGLRVAQRQINPPGSGRSRSRRPGTDICQGILVTPCASCEDHNSIFSTDVYATMSDSIDKALSIFEYLQQLSKINQAQTHKQSQQIFSASDFYSFHICFEL